MRYLLAILALCLTCTAQNYTVHGDHWLNASYNLVAADGMTVHPTPACDGWYGKQVGSNCVLTFRFREMDGLTCVVNTNPNPDAGQSPVEVVCTYPVEGVRTSAKPHDSYIGANHQVGGTATPADESGPMIDKKEAK